MQPMIVQRETVLPCTPDAAWREVKRPALLIEVAHPLVTLKPVEPATFSAEWPAQQRVQLRSYLLQFIPLGLRTLYFEQIDNDARVIQTREHDRLIRKWDHRIEIRPNGDGKTRYSDTVEIDAGLVTLPVWLFARVFYWHRQRRWQSVAARLSAVPATDDRSETQTETGASA